MKKKLLNRLEQVEAEILYYTKVNSKSDIDLIYNLNREKILDLINESLDIREKLRK